MPIYQYKCDICGNEVEKVQSFSAPSPKCCDCNMGRKLTYPIMVKMKGDGGYPSRRKYMDGTAPNTTRAVKPWGTYDPACPPAVTL